MNENEAKKKSATILQSQYEAIKKLSEKKQIIMFHALFDYEIYGIEPDFEKFNDVLNTIWELTKPLIDNRILKSAKLSENGKKGGAPRGNKNASKAKQAKTTKNNQKQGGEGRGEGEGINMDSTSPETTLNACFPEEDELRVDEYGNFIWDDED